MYLMYADESGDPGLGPGPTQFFVVTGIIVHESDWNEVFQKIVDLRRWLSVAYNLPQRMVWHATDIVNQHGDFHHSRYGLTTEQCFSFYDNVVETLAQLTQLRVLNVFVRKDRLPTDPKPQVYDLAWTRFIQRFHNFLDHGGTRDKQEWGVLITDRRMTTCANCCDECGLLTWCPVSISPDRGRFWSTAFWMTLCRATRRIHTSSRPPT